MMGYFSQMCNAYAHLSLLISTLTAMSTAKRVQHHRSLTSTLSDIWAGVSQLTVSRLAKSQYVANMAEGAVAKYVPCAFIFGETVSP